jgi:hypothetical protein
MRRALLLIAVALVLPASAQAFGTVGALGQAAEHENITRAGLWCSADGHPKRCFEDWSISQLAGARRSVGAVGAPDLDSANNAATHCDNSDYLDVQGYPQSREDATAALFACRQYAAGALSTAVDAAKKMLDAHGKLIAKQVEPSDCTFQFSFGGAAKCEVFDALGRTLHTAEDFYSHTNWADQSDPTESIGIDNPPGLHIEALSPLFDYNALFESPVDLSGGCFILSLRAGACDGRVTHDVITKDEGTINPRTGDATNPRTPRGRILNNFADAVRLAILESRRQWETLQTRLIDEYGKRKGNLMICALTHDHPIEACQLTLTLTGTETVTWKADFTDDPIGGACGDHVTGNGRTTITFSTREPVHATPDELVPSDTAAPANPFAGVVLPSRAKIDSRGTQTVTPTSECAGGGTKPPATDCGVKTINLDLLVAPPSDNALTLSNSGDPPDDPFTSCPNKSEIPRTVIGPDTTEFTADDLFDDSVEEITVKGDRLHSHVTLLTGRTHGTIITTTKLRWTLTIKKPPPAKAAGASRRR